MVELFFERLIHVINEFFQSSTLPNAIKWGAIAGIMMAVELSHRAWLIIWFALGALSAAFVSLLLPHSISIQFLVFFVVSGGSLGAFVYKRQEEIKNENPHVILPADRHVRVVEEINGSGRGVVTLDGVQYKARLEIPGEAIPADKWVLVTDFDTDDLTAVVRPTEEPASPASN